MEEQITGQEPEKETEQPAEETATPVDVNKIVKDYEYKLQQMKSAQSGSDRMVSELRKELDEMRKSQMSDKERIEYERKISEQEKLSFERERAALEKDKLKFKFMAENKIDSRFEAFLSADSEDALKEQITILKALIEDNVKPVRDELEKLKSDIGRPGGGTGATIKDWKTASLSEQTAEYKRIENSQGTAAAQAWLKNLK